MKTYKPKIAIRLAIWLLSKRYLMGAADKEVEAYQTAIHELQFQNATLRKERDHFKLRASISAIKGQFQ